MHWLDREPTSAFQRLLWGRCAGGPALREQAKGAGRARVRPALEQKQAVVLEPAERRAVTLVQQLSALRSNRSGPGRARSRRASGRCGPPLPFRVINSGTLGGWQGCQASCAAA